MCAPSVINVVRQDISRRRFLAAFGASAATAVAATAAGLAQEKPVRLGKGFRDVYDLTHTFSPRLPVFPAFKPMQIRQRFTIARDGFFANEITFDEHTGTHLDAPAHFIANGGSADRIAVDRLIAPLAVVSIEGRAAKDADTMVAVDDLLAWEKRHGRLPAGAFVAMHSGWEAHIGNADRFLNRDAKGTMHAPGFSEAAARFLVQERDIVGAGVDTLSLDAAAAQKFVAHLALLGAGKYGVELMANLARVSPAGATIIVGGPKHEGASGGPVRIFGGVREVPS
jgi:kynurenine formamidase